MKVSELIERLELVKAHIGDIECLVEVVDEGSCYMMPVEDISYEDREGHGKTVALLQ
jgi:hypothetical protein